MSLPFKPKWQHSALAATPNELASLMYGDGAATARPTGAVPAVRPTRPGVYAQPLSALAKLSPAPGQRAAAAAGAPSSPPADNGVRDGGDSARKRVQAWEEKRVRFMEAQQQERQQQRQQQTRAEQQPVTEPQRAPAPATTTTTAQQRGPPPPQVERAQAPSPSTPRGLGYANSRPTHTSAGAPVMRTTAVPAPAAPAPTVTPPRFGRHVSSMYTDLEERRSERKKQRAYMRELDSQVNSAQQSGAHSPSRRALFGRQTMVPVADVAAAVGPPPSERQRGTSSSSAYPTTEPRGAASAKRLSAEEYRAELDRQVQAKLAALRADVETTARRPRSSPTAAAAAAATFTTATTATTAATMASPSPPQSAPLSRALSASSFSTANMHAQAPQAAFPRGHDYYEHQEQGRPSSQPMSVTAAQSPPYPVGSRPLSRMTAAEYRAELDAQIRAKGSASSSSSSSSTASAPPSALSSALPTSSDSQQERALERARQASYRMDLDALVKSRQQQRMQQQQDRGYSQARASRSAGSVPSSSISNGDGNGILARLGSHHFHNTPASLTQPAPGFGRGLSSMHRGQTDPMADEMLQMKRRQYRLELETQMEQQKRRNADMDYRSPQARQQQPPPVPRQQYNNFVQQPTGNTMPGRFAARAPALEPHPQQPQQGQPGQPRGFEFAGFAGLGNANNRANRNVRLGARRHIETESPEILAYEQQQQRLKAKRQESYAAELREQMKERDARRKAEKERIQLEDQILARKIALTNQAAAREAEAEAGGDGFVAAVNTAADSSAHAVAASAALPPRDLAAEAAKMAAKYSVAAAPVSAPTPSVDTDLLPAHAMPAGLGGAAHPGGGALVVGISPTGSDAGGKWRGFTRFKSASRDPQEQEAALRKQKQQDRTASTLRAQIEERKRRKAEAQRKAKEEEEAEERRIERERRELMERYAAQTRAEHAQRQKNDSSPTAASSAPTTSGAVSHSPARRGSPARKAAIARSVSAPTGAAGAGSPAVSAGEQELFRQEMELKQRELEAQLQFQQNLVAEMQETMAQAIAAQQQQQQQQQEHQPPPQKIPAQQQQQQQQQYSSSHATKTRPQDQEQYQKDFQQQFRKQYQLRFQEQMMGLQPDDSDGAGSSVSGAARRQWSASPTAPVATVRESFTDMYQEIPSSHSQDDRQLLRAFAAGAPAPAAVSVSSNRPPLAPARQVPEGVPRPIPSAAPPLAMRGPVDPAFLSRPKIINSLDQRTMASVMEQQRAQASPQLDVDYDEYGNNILERSLDSRSKLVRMVNTSATKAAQVSASPAVNGAAASGASMGGGLSSISTAMGQTWRASQSFGADSAIMPPRPSPEPELSTRPGSSNPRARLEVERSLASSSRLIFLKSGNRSPQRKRPSPRQQRQPQPQPLRRSRTRTPSANVPHTIQEEDESNLSGSLSPRLSPMQQPPPQQRRRQQQRPQPEVEESSPSDLPTIAWDKNASPAHHPQRDTHTGAAHDASAAVTTPQAANTTPNAAPDNNSSNNPSPSMQVVASFLGVNPMSPGGVAPPAPPVQMSHSGGSVFLTSSVDDGNSMVDGSMVRSPTTPPRRNLTFDATAMGHDSDEGGHGSDEDGEDGSKFRVHTPTRTDLEAMQGLGAQGRGAPGLGTTRVKWETLESVAL